ncbi:hypothetical protein HYH03_011546 [Edaphochlamys debaryana]|uniref:Pectate lyase superfamily protein domain-containing protein n=1 Tax=Edaphochlamys debaryana TaxID=47281 RepID=A0A835XUH5_9CHLO|nr:hypothetical protein HYH03_011546 [Edaphochlamys debaryana]|eukprot:KAG2489907.1 hypothetical protein HYH03_011546 [Edaphochlamys debaryana]
MTALLALGVLCALLANGAIGQRVCSPSDHGAVGDGRTLDTAAVQAALAACEGGGTVRFLPGTYLLGSVTLSGLGLHLELPEGAELRASAERYHYGPTQDSWYLLRFLNCTGCSLTGAGTVRGAARAFLGPGSTPSAPQVLNWDDPSCPTPRQCRPRLVGVVGSSGVEVAGVTLADSAFWTLHVIGSSHVGLRGLSVYGDAAFPNNDGIDIDGSSWVEVERCRVSTADDALCLKATRPGRPTHHVAVRDCELASRSAAVKIGSETRADIAHVSFERITVRSSNRGLALQLRDAGAVTNITFAHCAVSTARYPGRWWGGGEPIYVTAAPRWPLAPVGRLQGVRFVNVTARTRGGVVVLAGSSERAVRDVELRGVHVRLLPPPPPAAAELASAAAAAALPAGSAPPLRPAGPRDLRRWRRALAETPPDYEQAARAVEPDSDLADAAVAAAAAAAAAVAAALPAGSARAAEPDSELATAAAAAAGLEADAGVKLDLRPGLYGVRWLPWSAAAPLLAQYVLGLTLADVSFELAAGTAAEDAEDARAWDLPLDPLSSPSSGGAGADERDGRDDEASGVGTGSASSDPATTAPQQQGGGSAFGAGPAAAAGAEGAGAPSWTEHWAVWLEERRRSGGGGGGPEWPSWLPRWWPPGREPPGRGLMQQAEWCRELVPGTVAVTGAERVQVTVAEDGPGSPSAATADSAGGKGAARAPVAVAVADAVAGADAKAVPRDVGTGSHGGGDWRWHGHCESWLCRGALVMAATAATAAAIVRYGRSR